MKKRRELNALMSKSSTARSTRIKNGVHELLRNDSCSSEEEFVLPVKDVGPTKNAKRNHCLSCLLIFSVTILLSCFGVMASLLWMFIQLKNDVQDLRLQISKIESSTSQRITDLVMKGIQVNLKLNNLEIKNEELNKTTASISAVQNQLSADVESTLKILKNDMAELRNFRQETLKSLGYWNDNGQILKVTIENLKNITGLLEYRISYLETVNCSHQNSTILVRNTNFTYDVENPLQSLEEYIKKELNSSLSSLMDRVKPLETGLVLSPEPNHLLDYITNISTSQPVTKIDKMSPMAAVNEDVLGTPLELSKPPIENLSSPNADIHYSSIKKSAWKHSLTDNS